MIRCSTPSITDVEKAYVSQALECSDVGVGMYIDLFERKWAEYNRKGYGVSCNSGTSALYLALRALGVGEGDEVIIPEFTMACCAFVVSQTGAKPVFVDCKDDLTIDPEIIEDAITDKTKAIMAVHIYGRKCDMLSINRIAIDNRLYVVEDLAEAHGIIPTGDIACYSFYGNKILTTGEGGMCLTDNKNWADEMRYIANLCIDKERTLIHQDIGHNFRMTNLQAAIGVAQIERIGEILGKRLEIEEWYDKYLPSQFRMPNREVLWMYDINCGDKQEEIKKKLADRGIESRYGFKPMSMQPPYLQAYDSLNAYKWSKKLLYLPTWTDMTEDNVKTICQALQ